MSEQKSLFVVENGLNTCYIDALLMALFYKPSTYLDTILNTEPKNLDYIYLQELIRNKFVENVRKNNSVMADTMNEIRNYANMCGWLENCPNEFFQQQEVKEFYSFLLNITNVPLIEIHPEPIPFINLPIPDNVKETSVKALLNNWMNNNVTDRVDGVCKIVNVPTFVALSLNRFSNVNKRIGTPVDIQRKIKLHHVTDRADDGLKWSIHSIICYKGETTKNGHYYSVLHDRHDKRDTVNKWIIFDDTAVPCVGDIDIKNAEITGTIKKECVMIIYCYDDHIF
jgi:uncharacterized UBP type Zn finger protein